jgi:hypothetical protein
MQFSAGQSTGYTPEISNVSLPQGGGSPVRVGRYPNSLEVDWMRSDGRVRVMQDSGERSAIIWVKRRNVPAALPVVEMTPQAEASSWTVIDRDAR